MTCVAARAEVRTRRTRGRGHRVRTRRGDGMATRAWRRAMDDPREEKIRVRAYEIWERQGRTGAPEDHWLEAERESKAEEPTDITSDRSEATVEEAPLPRPLKLSKPLRTIPQPASSFPRCLKAECIPLRS